MIEELRQRLRRTRTHEDGSLLVELAIGTALMLMVMTIAYNCISTASNAAVTMDLRNEYSLNVRMVSDYATYSAGTDENGQPQTFSYVSAGCNGPEGVLSTNAPKLQIKASEGRCVIVEGSINGWSVRESGIDNHGEPHTYSYKSNDDSGQSD